MIGGIRILRFGSLDWEEQTKNIDDRNMSKY